MFGFNPTALVFYEFGEALKELAPNPRTLVFRNGVKREILKPSCFRHAVRRLISVKSDPEFGVRNSLRKKMDFTLGGRADLGVPPFWCLNPPEYCLRIGFDLNPKVLFRL